MHVEKCDTSCSLTRQLSHRLMLKLSDFDLSSRNEHDDRIIKWLVLISKHSLEIVCLIW